ncbi:MAG: hypothetical protein JXD22_12460 [Sedimentisphaerales bacterium]|nr:hypothetical protein [Sedimentisphaerales bacterium]
MNNKLIVILDDDAERVEMMRQEITKRFPDFDYVFFDNAPDMIAWLRDSLEKVAVISLDHDLGPNQERAGRVFDPGTGRDVVDFLESHKPDCPVLIHTTNQYGGDGMKYALEDFGWSVKRVIPMNDLSWIKDEWIEKIADLINSTQSEK